MAVAKMAKKTAPAVPAVKETGALGREILYPKVIVEICCGDNALTAAKAKKLLGWETEQEYITRTGEKTGYGKEFMFEDIEGNKVQCWNNSTNRPFNEPWCRQLCQDILNRNWEFNLETIVISKTGLVTSGQHRMIGVVFASQLWASDKQKHHWLEIWDKEPTIETLIAFGGSEEQKVLSTVDNVRPRSLSDVFYTSELFNTLKSTERNECSRMLDTAVDLLWKRVGAVGNSGGFDKYQSHSASMLFVERHKKILDMVKHIFEENSQRALSVLKLSPGQCSAMAYLMGASSTDIDIYRNADPPCEEHITWDNWEKSQAFWVELASGIREPGSLPKEVADAFALLCVGESTGTATEKISILCLAWEQYVQDQAVSGMLDLEYHDKEDGTRVLGKVYSAGGIDLGNAPPKEPDPPAPTPEQLEAQKVEERKAKTAAISAKLQALKATKPATKPDIMAYTPPATAPAANGAKLSVKPALKPGNAAK